MSVLIKDMEMPKEGFVEILVRDDGTVQQTGQSYRIDGTDYYTPYAGEMPVMYKAVPIPPHGRLIDADALYRTIDATSERTIGHTTFKETVLLDIRGMPTILESTMGQVNSEKAINEAEREE